jgi:rubrerythrin
MQKILPALSCNKTPSFRETNRIINPQKDVGGNLMTVQKDLEKALAAAESAKGTYATFAAATDDQTAKQMFTKMSQDMEQHVSTIEDRLSSTATTAQLNTESASTITSSTSSATLTNQQS